MTTFEGLEFVNRGAELNYLKNCLERADQRPAFVIIRSPTGYGKSTLTDQLSNLSKSVRQHLCTVDPNIRGRTGSISLHEGFFIQRLAEALNLNSYRSNDPNLAFNEFLKANKSKLVKTKDHAEVLSELPSVKNAYKVIYDYAARTFSFGKYKAEKLLTSDEAHAVAICTAYTQQVLHDHFITLIIREVQHIDLYSLRSLLLWTEKHPGPNLIFEYTTETGKFEPEHQKLILKHANRREGLDILDLVRLGADHLEFLIRTNVRDDFELNSDFYLSWDGNLRSIVELKFQVGIGRSLTDNRQIVRALSDLTETVIDHVSVLTPLHRMVLAVVLSHVESIGQTTLLSVLSSIDPHIQQTTIDRALAELEIEHSFLGRLGSAYSIRNDTVAAALRETKSMQGLVALAERTLRDYYRKAIESKFAPVGLAESVRHYFRLCALTKDSRALVEATSMLKDIIQHSSDQSIYVDVVASAIEADGDLYRSDHDALVEWAAELAYEASDWRRALNLIELISNPSPFVILLKACSLQECGGHIEALKLVDLLKEKTFDPSVLLASDLVVVLVKGCRGEVSTVRKKLQAILTNPAYKNNPLLGYAYRFFEIVEDRNKGLNYLQASAECFEKSAMYKSKAYSQLPAAILLARKGKITEAIALAQEAVGYLSGEVHDKHIVLNNLSAIELLKDNPDFSVCCAQLNSALRFARDDFSELTILSNLSIVYLQQGDIEASLSCCEKCRSILEHPNFVDTDIFWPVCLNISEAYRASGDQEKCLEILQFVKENAAARNDNTEYWNFRYGETSIPHEDDSFMLRKPWHPVYLSHWLIDLEGLILLKGEPVQ